ncbi:23S rRNA (guanosine(2251)-2'-O)-methyltransferase RlmB [Nitrincola tibetensis]|uniref:23S rRNA (guanosine-2'-O-)-methyltransferase RlmB n=1 Tax=Nitrincola tibetensis TaxID=2219697 RepID=A0A364NL56_9GAMM|nr:23S rRNA (guanosine(2251)-2'-O)-methyltransferase RlmB [Nitrincola tibetensis]RAU17781.1 23S rRNA (guanosine(2251)-2'-O)-methyltransferase RlmB [Nitrincola tibetensis]
MSFERVFGLHAITTLLERDSGRIKVLFVQEGREDARISPLLEMAIAQGISIQKTARKRLDDMVEGSHQGVIAECKPIQTYDESYLTALLAKAPSNPLFLILDGVTDPHNLGACLRTAEAAGVLAVIAPRDKSAPLNATVSKVACGAAEIVPYIQVTNLSRTLQSLQQAGVWITGTAGEAEQTLFEADLKGPMALVMGAEGKGMRRLTREHCDQLIKIPMLGSLTSLNVSVATGVCLFEVLRQRCN